MIASVKDKLESWLKGRMVYGVSVELEDGGKHTLDAVLLNKVKDELEIVKSFTNIRNIEELSQEMNKDIPVCLNISGKGIVAKTVKPKAEIKDNSDLLKMVLPDAKNEDFLIRSITENSNSYHVMISRKSFIEETVEKFNGSGFNIIHVDFGICAIDNFLPVIEQNTFIYTRNYAIALENNSIESITLIDTKTNENKKFTINEEDFDSHIILAYATALSFYNNIFRKSHFSSLVSGQTDEFLFRNIFKKGKIVAAIVVFIVLLGNFLVYSHYYKRLNELPQSFNADMQLMVKLDSVKSVIKFKSQFYNDLGFNQLSRNSFFADRVASTIPEGIKVLKIEICPVSERIMQEREIKIKNNTVVIKGEIAGNVGRLNTWIDLLNDQKWVSSSTLKDISQQTGNNITNFLMEIIVK